MSNVQPQVLPAPPASSSPIPCPLCGHPARLTTDKTCAKNVLIYGVECGEWDECSASINGFASAEAAIAKWNSRHVLPVLLAFYNEVCDQAERNMAATDTVSGAHWDAMRQVLKAKGVEVNR